MAEAATAPRRDSPLMAVFGVLAGLAVMGSLAALVWPHVRGHIFPAEPRGSAVAVARSGRAAASAPSPPVVPWVQTVGPGFRFATPSVALEQDQTVTLANGGRLVVHTYAASDGPDTRYYLSWSDLAATGDPGTIFGGVLARAAASVGGRVLSSRLLRVGP